MAPGTVETVPGAGIGRADGYRVIDSKGVIGLAGPGERGETDFCAFFINGIEGIALETVSRHQSVPDGESVPDGPDPCARTASRCCSW